MFQPDDSGMEALLDDSELGGGGQPDVLDNMMVQPDDSEMEAQLDDSELREYNQMVQNLGDHKKLSRRIGDVSPAFFFSLFLIVKCADKEVREGVGPAPSLTQPLLCISLQLII